MCVLDALGLTTAVKHTGQAYFAIGQLYEEQVGRMSQLINKNIVISY